MQNRIFSIDNPKASKAIDYGHLNAIHYMAPYTQSGVNLCPHASPGCIALCLGWTSGHAGMVKHDDAINSVRQSRIDKAKRFMRDRKAYLKDVYHSIVLAKRKAERMGLKLCVRLNGSTDIGWEALWPEVFRAFPDVQFVDYTKSERRALDHARGLLPANYHLTFSRAENNEDAAIRVLKAGGNVAVVFRNGFPTEWNGYRVIDGDTHDLRHLDAKGVVVGLSPKGMKAKKDTSGFVVD